MTVVLDDHLLRDHLVHRNPELRDRTREQPVATSNLFYVRLCRAARARGGGPLVGGWGSRELALLGRSLVNLPDSVRIEPLRNLVWPIAELMEQFRLSALGAEAVAACSALGATLLLSPGNDAPGVRAGCRASAIKVEVIGS